MNYPPRIIRKDDKEVFIHLGNGYYRTEWGHENGSISKTPFSSFPKEKFNFNYKKPINHEHYKENRYYISRASTRSR